MNYSSNRDVKKMVKRIIKFDNQDWKHVNFLFVNMIKQFVKGDFNESKEAFYFLRLHFTHDSQKVG
jgi:hypothetical protein